MSYRAQEPLLEQARNARGGIGHLVFGVASIAVFGQAAMVFVALFLFGLMDETTLSDPDAPFAASPAETMIFLLSFAAWAGVLALTLRSVHGRNLTSLLGEKFIGQFLAVLSALIVLQVVLLILPPWAGTQALLPGMPLSTWSLVLPLSLVAVFIQAGTEELVFRGYLQQHLAVRFQHPFLWLILPACLFGVIHYDAQAGTNAWLVVGTATLFGLIAADLTARSGSLGPAIALHVINNVLALLFVSLDGDLSGLALFKYPYDLLNEAEIARLIPVEIALLAVSWLAARLVLRR